MPESSGTRLGAIAGEPVPRVLARVAITFCSPVPPPFAAIELAAVRTVSCAARPLILPPTMPTGETWALPSLTLWGKAVVITITA